MLFVVWRVFFFFSPLECIDIIYYLVFLHGNPIPKCLSQVKFNRKYYFVLLFKLCFFIYIYNFYIILSKDFYNVITKEIFFK